MAPPLGLAEELFAAYVAGILRQMPLLIEVDKLALSGLTDAAAHELLANLLSDGNGPPADDCQQMWRIVKLWLVHFFPGSYRLDTGQEVLVKGTRPPSTMRGGQRRGHGVPVERGQEATALTAGLGHFFLCKISWPGLLPRLFRRLRVRLREGGMDAGWARLKARRRARERCLRCENWSEVSIPGRMGSRTNGDQRRRRIGPRGMSSRSSAGLARIIREDRHSTSGTA